MSRAGVTCYVRLNRAYSIKTSVGLGLRMETPPRPRVAYKMGARYGKPKGCQQTNGEGSGRILDFF